MTKNVTDMQKYVQDLLDAGQKPVYYTKTARIKARPGVPGETIVTKLADGHKETENPNIETGDMVVTNPGGEQYVVKAETFKKKYEIDPDNPEQYRPTGGAQQFLRLKEDIDFKVSWGEQSMRKGDFINITARASGDIYGVGQKEFFDTYGQCTQDGKLLPTQSGRSGIVR
ncbi:MAG: hypothetical protein IJ532_01760 [Alphaproteobacteria bacterium]|nr:hypothetical protein [Alphaproteobacteria bacterium]